MKTSSWLNFPLFVRTAMAAAAIMAAGSCPAQLVAYDDAGNYLATANWTNGANQGFGFTPWTIVTNGPNFTGNFINTANNPTFVIASVTNVLATNYTCVWGTYANGTNGVNTTVAFRGFTNSLGTNTFKLQWGSTGAGNQNVAGLGTVHGWCGFSLRTGNDTTQPYDYADNESDSTAMFYLYFLDGLSPSTIYIWDGNGAQQSVPNTSFSNLGRNNITNAIEAEVTPGPDGQTYHLVLKDCVQNVVLFTMNSIFLSSGTVDSAALFCDETTGDQIYNRMQIAASTNIPPQISNLQPADGSVYLSPATSLSFEVDSFNSTVASNAVSVYLNGVLQTGFTYNTTSPTPQLTASANPALAANTFYTYTIVAQDAYGNVVSNNYTFNTFDPNNNLFIDAMDYNYTTNNTAGQFINPPGVGLYGSLIGTNGIDYLDLTTTNEITAPTAPNGNENAYRPENVPAPQLLVGSDTVDHEGFLSYNDSLTDYQLAFTEQGEWDNYTRIFPTTNYTIYARAASGTGGQFELARLANPTATVSNQPSAVLGTFTVQNTGGSTVYKGQLSPLLDFFGSTVVMPLAGTNTLQQIATQSRTYNLSYLIFVTNTTAGTLRPYISVGSPAPNSPGVSLSTPINLTLVNRQTTVTTNTLQVFLSTTTNNVTTTTNLTSHLVLSSNAAGVTVTYTPKSNLPANSSNTVTVIFTDSSSVNVTNYWSFVTGTSGGTLGSGLWSGAGGVNDEFWADAINWSGNTPGPGFSASFASPGATTTLMTNNIVAANVTILQLFYETNSSGYHTTWIQDGVTLTVSNSTTGSVTPIMQTGAGANADIVATNQVTNTITGNGGTLILAGSPTQGANELNFQNRMCISPGVPNAETLDMSGLGTFIATVGKFTVCQGGSGYGQSNVTACVNLAKTNIIAVLRNTSPEFDLGDSSGAENMNPSCLAGSTLNLGKTNAFYFGNGWVGVKAATNNLVRFNPIFTNNFTPYVLIRGSNGPASAMTAFFIGYNDGEPTTIPTYSQGAVDFSGGTVDALINTMVLGWGGTQPGDTGFAQGTFTFTAGTLNVGTLTNGWQVTADSATETGTVNVNGTATLVSTNIILAKIASGGNTSLVTGTLNVTNGAVQGNIFAGGGVSTVNVNGGTLVVSNTVGTAAVPLSALNLTSASLHLKVDGNAPAASVYAAAVSASGTLIAIDSVANVTSPTTNHLISYSGTDPYNGLSLAALPFGFAGSLLDNSNSASIDLVVSAVSPTPPAIGNITIRNGQLIISGNYNLAPVGGGGSGYHVLTSTNLSVPVASWTVLASGTFNLLGNYSSTNLVGTNSPQFYRLRVP